MNNVHTPETEEYGISSFVFEARNPFHPARLFELLNTSVLREVVRAKGLLWLATRPAYVGLLSKAGRSSMLGAIGTWWDTLPEAQWDLPDDEKRAIKADWHPSFGDRKQQLVFIGIDLDEADIRRKLEAALVTDEEAAGGLALWSSFHDPLPAWA